MPRTDFTTDRQPHAVGDRVLTAEKLTLPEGFEELEPMLAGQQGTVRGATVHQIDNPGGDPISLSVCEVELDALPGKTLTFHVDELYAQA